MPCRTVVMCFLSILSLRYWLKKFASAVLYSGCILCLPAVCTSTQIEVQPVDFEHEVWPILLRQCIGCHGPEEQQGQLRLDSRRAAMHGGVSGPLFGESAEESLLLHRLTSEDDALKGNICKFQKNLLIGKTSLVMS